MKKTTLLILIFLLALGVTSACSEQSSGVADTKHKDTTENSSKRPSEHQTAEKNKDPEQPSDDKGTAKPSDEKKNQDQPENPFKPLVPKKDSKSLEDNYTKEEINKMPVLEAHGDTRERSVPFGQTLQKGAEDTTNGPLQHYRMVAFYGNPHSKQMGILGELEPKAFMKKLKEQAQAYSDADPSHPAIPTIELITTIAQRDPGPDNLYYHITSEDDIKEYAKLAKDNGAILLLDVQLGRDSIMHQVKLLEKYLELPYVYLAIDTEFHVKEGQTPGVNLGHVDGANIQKAVEYVSELTKKNNLPDKVVVIHQFKGDIIANKKAIKPTKNTEVVINYDGFGAPGNKLASYHGLVRNETVQYGGFKLFYKNDQPLLTPKEVIQLDPAPAVIDYQ